MGFFEGASGTVVGSAVAYLMLDTSNFKEGINSAMNDMKTLQNDTLSFSDKMKNVGSAMSTAGASLTRSVTLPLVGIGTAAVKTAGDFDQSMSKVEAISGATADQMQELRDKALEMGSKTKFSAKESADAFTYMAMAGWKSKDMMEGIQGIMSLAAADGLDLATTSDIVTDALTAFGLEAGDAGHFADVLAAASSNANTNVSMLGESFKYVAPVAGSLGMSAEDTAVALGLMANSGIKASMAGTSLRSLLTNMAKPTDTVASAMSQLDVSLTNADGSTKSLMEVMKDLRKGFDGGSIDSVEFSKAMGELQNALDDGSMSTEDYEKAVGELAVKMYGADGAQKAQLASMLAGKTAMAGLLAIVNTSQEDFDDLANSIYNCKGRADDMAETMMDNLPGSLTLLKSALEGLAIKVGEALIPTINAITKFITALVDKMNQMDERTLNIIVTIAAVVAALGPVLLIIGKVITAVTSIIGVVSKLFSAGSLLLTGIKALAGFVTGTLIPAIGAISVPVLAVIAVITALIAVGVLLYKNWDEISAWAKKSWEAIKETINNAVEGIEEFFENLKQSAAEAVENLLNKIKEIWDGISSFFKNVSDAISNFFKEAGRIASEFFKEAIDTVSNWIKQIVEVATNFFKDLVSWLQNLFTKLNEAYQTLVGFLKNLFESITSFLKQIIDGIISWGKQMAETALSIGKNFVDAFVEHFKQLLNFIQQAVAGVLEFIVGWGNKIVEAGVSIGKGFIDGVVNGVKNVVQFFSDTISNIFDVITTIVPKMIEAGKKLITGLWEGMKSAFTSLKDWLTEAFAKIIDPIKEKFDAIFSPIKNMFSSIGSLFDGSHANGLDYVPYNGYVAQLHEGERVLTKEENKEYNNGKSSSGDTFIFNSPKAIDEYEAARQMKKAKKELEYSF